jgi:hypothetical protein
MGIRTRANHKELTVFLQDLTTTRSVGTLVQLMRLSIFEIDSLVPESILTMAMVLRGVNLLGLIGLYP